MTIGREHMLGPASRVKQATFATPRAQRSGVTPWLNLEGLADHGDRLALLAEPVEHSLPGATVARNMLTAIRDLYHRNAADDPIAAMLKALETANHTLYHQNSTGTPGQRVILGLTFLVIREQDLFIGQVPPTQLILTQGEPLVALPELASWRSGYQPPAGMTNQQGLGATPTVQPLFFRASLEQGDLILLSSTNLACALEADNDPALRQLLSAPPAETVALLQEIAGEHSLDPAFAAAFMPCDEETSSTPHTFPDPTGASTEAIESEEPIFTRTNRGWIDRGLREMRERTRVIGWPLDDTDSQGRIIPLHSQRRPSPPSRNIRRAQSATRDTPRPARRSHAHEEREWEDHATPPLSAPAHPVEERAALLAAYRRRQVMDVAPGHAPARRRRAGPGQAFLSIIALILLAVGSIVERLVPPSRQRRRQSYFRRSRDRVWPIGNLERHQVARSPLPRILPWIVLIILVLSVILLILSIRNRQVTNERTTFAASLGRVTAAREAALASPDRAAAYAILLSLPDQLATIPDADRPGRPELIAAEAAAINSAIDRVSGVERLSGTAIQVVATAPPVGALTERPQIVIGKGQPYVLLNGTVYGVDSRNHALAKLLAKGDVVAGVGVGQIQGIVWRSDTLFAYTDTNGFARDSSGRWLVQPLAASGRKGIAAASFEGNLYLLEPDRGQIIKFAAGRYNQSPQPWSSGNLVTDLNLALDLTIDRDVYVLLANGSILDLFQGEVKSRFTPVAVPPLTGAAAIHGAPDGRWLYVVDTTEGRLIRLARDGSLVGIYKPAAGDRAFTNAREVAADETTGLVYLYTDEGLISVRLP